MRVHPLSGILVAAGVVVFLGLWATSTRAAWDPLEIFTPGERVGVVEITGVISRATPILEDLKKFREDHSIRAIVVRINSPGGAVGPSQEIMEEINKTKKVKKVVASCGALAASGGYYIASAADLIMANPGTATGSIGVIMQLANVEQLTKKIGVDFYDIKAGALKDMGSPFKPMTPEEKAVFQSLLNNIHEQFINDVAKNRKLPVEKVRALATGRVYTGQEAKELGLVDVMGNFNDAVEKAGRMGGIKGKIETVYPQKRGFSLLKLLLGSDAESPLEFLTSPYPQPAFLPPWMH
uniref:Signal peptide peptidase SppA n=1 Tax=Desulfobacca acetoxidans TaxID=60893 RepID=A0A7V6DNI2_9BACT